MTVTKPTAEDMARDLAGDLELHAKATPGLWIAFTSPGGVYEGEVHAHQGNDMDGRLTHVLSTPEGDERDDDIRFAAEAHEGWPAAIRRAIWAEKFKAWVHDYLDAHGVPHHPPGTHGAEGCRIGDRMDWLMEQLRIAEAEVERLREMYAKACDRIL